MNVLLRLLATAFVAYGLSTRMLGGVHITDFKSAIIFAIVIGRDECHPQTRADHSYSPITIVTLGLFLLVINTLIILIIDKLMDNIRFDGFGAGPFVCHLPLISFPRFWYRCFPPQRG